MPQREEKTERSLQASVKTAVQQQSGNNKPIHSRRWFEDLASSDCPLLSVWKRQTGSIKAPLLCGCYLKAELEASAYLESQNESNQVKESDLQK